MAFKVTIGQYFNTESPIHSLDPRVKIGLTFAFMILVFLGNSIATHALVAVFLLAVISISRVPIGIVLRSIKPVFFLLVFTAVLNLFFVRTGDTVLALGPISITDDAIDFTFVLTFRLLFLMMGGSLLALTTSPIQLTDGVERILQPLARFGLPAHEFAMMMSIALRFIPTLSQEAERIVKAQSARGADLEDGRLRDRIQLFVPILVPLFASSLRHAEELAVAMEARCYTGGEGRTHYHELAVGRNDLVAVGVFVLFAAVLIGLRVAGV